MVIKLTKEDLIKAMTQPQTMTEATKFVGDVAGIGSEVMGEGEEGWLGKAENAIGRFVGILEKVEKIRENPMVKEVVSKYMAGKVPAPLQHLQKTIPQVRQGEALPPGQKAYGMDKKQAAKDQVELMIKSLQATQKAFGDIKISQILQKIKQNEATLRLTIEKMGAQDVGPHKK